MSAKGQSNGLAMRGIASVGVVIAIGAIFFAFISWRDAAGESGADRAVGTTVRGNQAVTNHVVPPVFGGDMTVRCQLPVRNWWDQPIHFVKIVPSCSCSGAKLAKEFLSLNGETLLEVEVKFPPVGGNRIITIQLQTDTGQSAVHSFEAVAYPHVRIESKSEVVALGKFLVGEERAVSANLTVHAPLGSELPVIRTLNSGEGQLVAKILSVGEAISLVDGSGRQAKVALDIRVKAIDRPGRFHRDLAIEYQTADGGTDKGHLLVTWEVESLFRFAPARLYLSHLESKSGSVERTVTVSSTNGGTFRILSARNANPWLELKSLPTAAAAEHQLTVALKPELLETTGHADLELLLDHPKQKSISLPVTIAISRERKDTISTDNVKIESVLKRRASE